MTTQTELACVKKELEVALTNVAASQEEIAYLNSSIQAQTEETVHIAVSDLSDLKTSEEFDAEYWLGFPQGKKLLLSTIRTLSFS